MRIVAVSEDKGTPLLGFVSNQILCDLTPRGERLLFQQGQFLLVKLCRLAAGEQKQAGIWPRALQAVTSPACQGQSRGDGVTRRGQMTPWCHWTGRSPDLLRQRRQPAIFAKNVSRRCSPSPSPAPTPPPDTLEQFGRAPAEA